MLSDFETIKTEYEKLLSAERKRIAIIFDVVGIIVLFGIAVPTVLFVKGNPTFLLLLLTGIYLVTISIFNLLISRKSFFKRVNNNFLYRKIIEDINHSENLSLKYATKIKERDFVKKGGLFTTFASIETNYKITLDTPGGNTVSIYDTKIVTRSNNTTIVHFDGSYYIFKHDSEGAFQLRSTGRPKLSKVKFKKLNTREDIKEYIEENSLELIDSKYYYVFDNIKSYFSKNKIYIGGVKDEIHLAIWRTKTPKMKELTYENYEQLKQNFLSRINLVKEIDKLVSRR